MVKNQTIYSDDQGNILKLSSVFEADQHVKFDQFSAKYVVSGKEGYKINNKKFTVHPGEYVIGNQNTSSQVFIDSTALVNGICIDISRTLISNIIDYKFNDASDFSEFLFDQDLMIQKYNHNNTTLGYSIRQIATEFDTLQNHSTQVNKEFFLSIAECVVNDQSTVFRSFKKLKSKKHDTNVRLFDFINDARNYIEHHFLDPLSLEDISKAAKISEYHFIRTFKTVFGLSPYKYLIHKRLNFARKLLLNNYVISDIAFLLHYNDTAAFSNAFKRYHGYPPSQLQQK